MTTPLSVDVAILGAGTAGLTARRSAKAAGASVVMIDPGPFGTTCARVGCMPSKLLIAAADAAHRAREAAGFGVDVGEVQVNSDRVLGRVRSERDRFVGFVTDTIEEARTEGELIVGRAKLTGAKTIEVDNGQIVHFDRLVIATGSTPFVPPPFRGLEHAVLTNEEIFELPELPESLLVIGLGVIGLELGQAFARLGVRTTLLGVGGGIGPLRDPEVLAEARAVFADDLDLHPDYQLKSIERSGDGVRIAFVDSKGVEREESFDRILLAAGRRPNLGNLGLEHLGIEPDERGRFEINPDTLQLGGAPAFVAGDVNGFHPLLHEAADDGRFAGRNAAKFPNIRAAQRRTPLGVVFSDPQIAIVGGGYSALGDCEAVAGEASFTDQGRARVQRENKGKIRIYAEKHSGRLLGAELLGPRAEHLSHLLAWSVAQGLTVDAALGMPFYHPVLEEGVRTALRDLNANLEHGDPIKCRVSEYGVGS